MTTLREAPNFIVFEGLDGSGKSTCARRTAEALDAELLTTPSEPIRQVRSQIISEFEESQEARQVFYISTVLAASERIRRLLDQGRSVVLDRYFLSTQAYASFRGTNLDLDFIGVTLVPADLTVFLHAPLDIRIQRIEQRGASAADRETMSPQADAMLRQEHLRRSKAGYIGEWLSLDSSEASPAELANEVIQTIRRPTLVT